MGNADHPLILCIQKLAKVKPSKLVSSRRGQGHLLQQGLWTRGALRVCACVHVSIYNMEQHMFLSFVVCWGWSMELGQLASTRAGRHPWCSYRESLAQGKTQDEISPPDFSRLHSWLQSWCYFWRTYRQCYNIVSKMQDSQQKVVEEGSELWFYFYYFPVLILWPNINELVTKVDRKLLQER